MPIHDLGYRPWRGPLVPRIGRFWVIGQTGMRLAWRNAWLRRILLLSWLPVVYVASLLLVYEQIQAHTALRDTLVPWIREIPITEDRHLVWACLLWIFFRYPQGLVMLLVIGQIAPGLVAQDVRSKAFLLYFSRPLARFEYVLGKMSVVWAYLLLITAAPGLVLYVMGVCLSPDWHVVCSTWDLPLRILAASAVLMVPTAALALAISSLTSESRYATFGWFAIWAVGWAAYAVIRTNLPPSADAHRWDLVSLYHTLGTVEYWVFGLKHELIEVLPLPARIGILPSPAQVQVWPGAIHLAVVTLVSLAILFRRVSSPMRI